jgi:ABC-type methionine transport system permease subunit
MNTRGLSTGFAWVFALVSLFGLGILYITFDQVFVGHLVPTMKGINNQTLSTGGYDQSTHDEINYGIDKYMDYFHIMPFIIFIVIVIYMFFVAVRKEGDSEFT